MQKSESHENVRIGVYVCHCGSNIAGTVDCAAVAAYARSLPGVVHARDQGYTCSEPGQAQIKQDIREYGLNRVVVASCSPRLHEPTFRKCVSEAGLNPYLLEMANIREQCSWVHSHDREGGHGQGPGPGALAVARARLLRVRTELEVPVTPAHAGHRRRRGRHPGRARPGRRGLPGGPGGEAALHRRHHGPAGQDLSHHGLLDLNSRPEDDGCRSTSQDQAADLSEVEEITGYVGNFHVKVRKKARYVDEKECTACGECAKVCPVVVPDEFNMGLSSRQAIYSPSRRRCRRPTSSTSTTAWATTRSPAASASRRARSSASTST